MVLTNLLVNAGEKAGANLGRKLRDTRMGYLPIYPEKNWDQTVLGYDYWGPAGESLPVTNTFLSAARGFSQDARRAKDPLTWATDIVYGLGSLGGSVLVGPITDTIGNVGNYAYNGYKRLYNYGANAYNNLADIHNNAIMQRQPEGVTMQAMQPVQYLGRKLPQRTDYLSVVSPQGDMPEVYNFNPALERIREEKLNAFRKPQLNATPDIINVTEGIGGTIAPATQEQMMQNRMEEAKSKIVKALGDLAVGKQIATAAGKAKAKALIDLYNKIK